MQIPIGGTAQKGKVILKQNDFRFTGQRLNVYMATIPLQFGVGFKNKKL